MRNNEQAIVEIVLRGQQPNATLRDLERSARALRAQLSRLPMDSQEFANRSRDLAQVNTRLRSIRTDLAGLGGLFQGIGREIKAIGVIGAAVMAFDFVKSKISSIVKGNAELSDSLADIRKTTGMTVLEVERLNSSLGQINTRTSTKELRNIAIAAGQLGIAKGDILKFTAATDKMNVALGDEFTGGATEVTKAMGGLRNTFKDIKTDKIDQDMLHIGNAVNELAANGAATGPVIADFANRIGGVGINLGLTSGQVLGLSATLQELQVSTERGGTAIGKILQKMTQNTSEFAKVAGMPVDKFTKLVNTDLFGAFTKVAEGSKKAGVTATSFGKILDTLGVDGAGASEVFSKLGNNTAMLNEKVLLANTSLKSTDSIMNEFNMKNVTLGAELDRLSKSMASAFTNSTISNGLKNIIGWIADIFDNTQKLSQSMEGERQNVAILAVEIGSANTTQKRRLEIYEELKAINPSIVSGIDKENISVQRLTENVAKYNAEAINRITIQKKQEFIDKANERASEKQQEVLKKEQHAYQVLADFMKRKDEIGQKARQVNYDQTLTISQKLLKVLDEVEKKSYKSVAGLELNEQVRSMKRQLDIVYDLGSAYKEFDEASANSNKLLNEKNTLMKRLGMSVEENKNVIDYTKLSIEQLNKYIRDSELSMGNFHAEEAIKSKEELLRRQKEKASGIIEIDDEQAKKQAALHEKLLDDLAKMEQDHRLAKLSKDARDMEEIQIKYDELRSRAGRNSKDLKRIKELENDDIMDLVMKQADDTGKIETKEYYEKLERVRKLEEEKRKLESGGPDNKKGMTKAEIEAEETRLLIEQWDKQIAEAKAHNATLLQGEEAYSVDIEKLTALRNAAVEALNNAHNEKTTKENLKALKQAIKAYEKYAQEANQLAQTFQEGQRLMDEKDLNDSTKSADAEIAKQKELLDSKVINQKQYEKRVAEIENEKAKRDLKLKQEAAAREKKYAMFQIAISTAVAVAKYLANTDYVGAILAGALGLAQLAVASSQPVPEYASGGLNKSADPQGFVDKPTYFTNSSSGQNFIAGEKGAEWIAPNWMLQDPVTANAISALETVRKRGFATGGMTSELQMNSGLNVNSGQQNFTPGISTDPQLVSALNKLNTILAAGIPAKLNYDQFYKDLGAIDSAKASAQIKN